MKKLVKISILFVFLLSVLSVVLYYVIYVIPNKNKIQELSLAFLDAENTCWILPEVYEDKRSGYTEEEKETLLTNIENVLDNYISRDAQMFQQECQGLKNLVLDEVKKKPAQRFRTAENTLLSVGESHVYFDTADITILVKESSTTVSGEESSYNSQYSFYFMKYQKEWLITSFSYEPKDI